MGGALRAVGRMTGHNRPAGDTVYVPCALRRALTAAAHLADRHGRGRVLRVVRAVPCACTHTHTQRASGGTAHGVACAQRDSCMARVSILCVCVVRHGRHAGRTSGQASFCRIGGEPTSPTSPTRNTTPVCARGYTHAQTCQKMPNAHAHAWNNNGFTSLHPSIFKDNYALPIHHAEHPGEWLNYTSNTHACFDPKKVGLRSSRL